MEIRRYAEIIRRWWWLIALGAVLASAAAYGYSRRQTPVYQASATLLVSEAPKANLSDYSAILTSQLLAQTYAQMLVTRPILQQVIARLELDTSAEELAQAVQVNVVRDTQLIKITVEDPAPEAAWATANTLPEVFQEYNLALQATRFAESKKSFADEITQLDRQIADLQAQIQALGQPTATDPQFAKLDRLNSDLTQLRVSRAALVQAYDNLRLVESQSTTDIVVVEGAVVPHSPVRPKTLTNTVLGAMVGLLLMLGVAFLIEYLDDTLKTPDEISQIFAAPLIGFVPAMEKKWVQGLYVVERPHTPGAEAFRSLRTNLEFAGVDQPLKTILVTSSEAGEGKSTVAVNLALVIAQSGKQVILIDADLRAPNVQSFFPIPNQPGLSDVLRGQVGLPEAIHQSAEVGLSVISAGTSPPNPAEILGSKRMEHILASLQDMFDAIVVDSPPFLIADAWILSAKVDGVAFVVQPGRTSKHAARVMMDQIKRGRARLVGIVLNHSRRHGGDYYYKSYLHTMPEDNGHGRGRVVRAVAKGFRELWRRRFPQWARAAESSPSSREGEQ